MNNFNYENWAKEKRHEYRNENKKMTVGKALGEVATDFVPKKINNLKITEAIKKYKYETLFLVSAAIAIGAIYHVHTDGNEPSKPVVENESNNDTEEFYSPIIPIKVYYEVESGDTISAIADKYDVNEKSIKHGDEYVNNDEFLQIGDKINFTYKITADEILFATNQIEKDESVPYSVLAYLYNTDEYTLERLNEKNKIPNTTLVPNFKGVDEIDKEGEYTYRKK